MSAGASGASQRRRRLAPKHNPFANDGSANSFFLHPTQCTAWEVNHHPPPPPEVQRVRARLKLLTAAVEALSPTPCDNGCCCLRRRARAERTSPSPTPEVWWSGVVSPSPLPRPRARAVGATNVPGTEVAHATAELPHANIDPPKSPASVESQVSTKGAPPPPPPRDFNPRSETQLHHAPAPAPAGLPPHTRAKRQTSMPHEPSPIDRTNTEQLVSPSTGHAHAHAHAQLTKSLVEHRDTPPQKVAMSDVHPVVAHAEPAFKSASASKGGVTTTTTTTAATAAAPLVKVDANIAGPTRRRRPLRARRMLPPMQVRIATSPTTPPVEAPCERRAALERLLETNAAGNFSVGATDGEPAPPNAPSPNDAASGLASATTSPSARAERISAQTPNPRTPPTDADNGHTLAFMACIVMVGLFFIIISN